MIFFITEYKKSENNFDKIYSLLVIVYSLANFSKLENFGAETQPILIIFIIIFYIIKYLNSFDINEYIIKILFYSLFAITLRIGSVIIIPIILIIILVNLKNIFIIFIKYLRLNLFLIFFITLFLFKNFILTGCLSYPIYWTCFDNNKITWANPIENTKERFEFISAISKRWKFYSVEVGELENKLEYYDAIKEGIILSPTEYNNDKFLWLRYWSKDHDVKRLLNSFVMGMFFLTLFYVFSTKKIIFLNHLN